MTLCLKRATIIPPLKGSGLNKKDMKTYRSISNLPLISNLIQTVVARRIEEHLEHNALNDGYQYAYHRGHSTETVPLKLHSDFVEALVKDPRRH